MNEKEQMVLDNIKENPFISQQELSDKVGLSRSTVANIISGLIKKEYVQGKAYVLSDEYPIVCIGAANVDRKFYVTDQLMHGTSNPIQSTKSIGGVARNIGENLGRLSQDVTLITACGVDSEWETIRTLTSPFINLDYVHQIGNKSTGSYTALISESGDMEYGFADMEVYDELTPEVLIQNTYILRRAKCIIADLNIPRASLEFLCAYAEKHDIKVVLIPVSGPKMKNLPHNLHAVNWMIVNRDETESYFDMRIKTEEDLMESARKWNGAGVEHVIVTNGSSSLAYSTGDEASVHIIEKSAKVTDVTGAGDSFSAAVVYGWLKGMDIEDTIKLGMINSRKTIETSYTVRQDLDEHQLLKNLEEIK
ncbi:carbohydrate kinase [Lacicoccus qingdaonensis]|uniref:Sugar or nucleoside kinase, ribokinase family n=1 Tax=Lacicoccus qingdaonensis TaxID=576118 RepID=A0A1G9JG21_9BACL|nr:carbohydrate kinase [Salinicoccus qingdaonensis]SDL36074.1 Sugar or nucleoside kinase, ribokinase family [Salinicoccus qingdaonensis]